MRYNPNPSDNMVHLSNQFRIDLERLRKVGYDTQRYELEKQHLFDRYVTVAEKTTKLGLAQIINELTKAANSDA